MSVQLPVDIVMGALPAGFKGNLQEYANAIADAMSATVDGTFLTGQIGGTMPTSNIGPWLTGTGQNAGWWFWDASLGQYVPSNQGTPVGTIVMWGGTGYPNNWLLCAGQQVSRQVYSLLFQAIGTTWGAGDGSSTFNLPPGGKFFINAAGFTVDAQVSLDSGYGSTSGVGVRGGAQTHKLVGTDMPPLKAQMWGWRNGLEQTGAGPWPVTADFPNATNLGTWPVIDANTNQVVGTNQTNTPVMPPFVSCNFIIKFQ